MTDIQKQVAEALKAVERQARHPDYDWPMWLSQEVDAALAAHRQQEARDPGLINALRVAWSGYVNLSADMEPGPLRKQMNKHADALQGVLEAHGIKGE